MSPTRARRVRVGRRFDALDAVAAIAVGQLRADRERLLSVARAAAAMGRLLDGTHAAMRTGSTHSTGHPTRIGSIPAEWT